MMNFPVNCDLAAQHRRELLAEAERDQLSRQALYGTTRSACRAAGDSRLPVLTWVRFALHRPGAAQASAGSA
jgi:hypothetical protein